MLNRKFIYLSICLLIITLSFAQQSDTTIVQSSTNKQVKRNIYGSARKATIMSACLPGLGQAYNKKYWKIPVIYAVLGGVGYWGVTNHNNYKYFSDNLRAIYDDDASTVNTSGYSSDQLISNKRYYKNIEI